MSKIKYCAHEVTHPVLCTTGEVGDIFLVPESVYLVFGMLPLKDVSEEEALQMGAKYLPEEMLIVG